MRILALMEYGARAASARQRLIQYLPHFAKHGIEVDVSPLLSDAHVERLSVGQRLGARYVAMAYLRRAAALLRAYHYDLIQTDQDPQDILKSLVKTTQAFKQTTTQKIKCANYVINIRIIPMIP